MTRLLLKPVCAQWQYGTPLMYVLSTTRNANGYRWATVRSRKVLALIQCARESGRGGGCGNVLVQLDNGRVSGCIL